MEEDINSDDDRELHFENDANELSNDGEKKIPGPKSHKKSFKACLKRVGKAGGKHPFYYVQKFRKEWLSIDEFKRWIEEVPDDVTKARCSWCQKVLNARLNDLKRHIKTKKHITLADQLMAGFNYVKGTSSADCSRDQLFTILRDISAMEENLNGEDESADQVEYETITSNVDRSFSSENFQKFAEEQSEQNRLLHTLINVQKERLSTDKERLETEKQSLLIQREILHVLKEKLNDVPT